MKKIERAKELTSHQNPEGKYDELFTQAMDELLNKIDPRLREARRMYKHKKKTQKLRDPLWPRPVRSQGQRGEPEQNQSNPKIPKVQPSKSLINNCGKAPFPQLLVRRTNNKKTKQTQTTKNPPPTSAVAPKNRHIPNKTSDKVWLRDQGKCQYKNQQTGKICGAKRYLELDHKYPFALGGEHSEENLQLRCRGHNQYRARELFF